MSKETERDELARVIVEAYGEGNDECPCQQDLDVAAHILAAGYGKLPEPIDSDKVTIINGWLVVESDGCTCAGGGDCGMGYAHERGCGYEPLMNITEPLAATGYTLTEGAS